MSVSQLTTVGVVIPFFQKEQDILKRCLESVMQQILPPNIRFLIIAVDDESPYPLADAVKDIAIAPPHKLVCLKRSNGGPGAARNTALNYLVDIEPEFVAFIDSDDIWQPSHISHALNVLSGDGDFFFCDHTRWNFPGSYLEDSKPFQDWKNTSNSSLLPKGGPQNKTDFEFQKGEETYSFIEDYLAQTSTVVYRFAKFPKVRFDPELRYAGEDNMFWIDLARSGAVTRVSCQTNVATGKGINMFAGAAEWSHPEAARRAAANVHFFYSIGKKFGNDLRATALFQQRLERHEAEFSEVWVRKLLKSPIEALRIINPLVKAQPSLPKRLILNIIFRKFHNEYSK
jgi:succinoglycan biosynthesis protein ExoW